MTHYHTNFRIGQHDFVLLFCFQTVELYSFSAGAGRGGGAEWVQSTYLSVYQSRLEVPVSEEPPNSHFSQFLF